MRQGSSGANDLEFDPLEGGSADGDAERFAGGVGDTAGPSTPGHRQAYHERPRRRRGPVVLLALLLAAIVVWLLFPDPPRATFSVEQLDFGTVRVGERSPGRVLTVTNAGERKLAVKALTFVNPVEADYEILENGCLAGKILSQESCEVQLAFVPQTPGDRSSVVRLESNDRTGPALALEATAVAPQLGLAPTALSFGVVALEGESEAREVTLSNVGSVTLSLQRIYMEGPAARDFSRSRRCPASKLEPGDACSFEIRFQPSVSGPRQAALVVDSDGLGESGRLALDGTGLWEGPPLDPGSGTLDFSEQKTGDRSAPKIVSFRNPTGGPVSVDKTSVTESTSFAVVEDGCRGRVVPSGETCSVALTFLPVRDGDDKGDLVLTAAGATEEVAVKLRGRGVTPKVEAATTSIEFAQQRMGFESAPRRIKVRNTGSATMAMRSVSVGGAHAAEFLLGTNECVGKPLPPGRECSIGLGFNPAETGMREAVLSVEPGFGLAPLRIRLQGSGAVSALRADPGRVDYHQVYLGGVEVRDLALTNEGSARLEIRGLRFEGSEAGAFDLGQVSCPLDSGIKSGASCKLELEFEPATATRHRAQLVIEYNGPDSPARVELVGEGRVPAPDFRLSTESLDLGEASIGGRGEIGTVVLSNPGAAWLTLTKIALGGSHSPSFQLVAGSCDGASALAPGGSCTVGVRLAPTEEGSLRASIVIRHGADPGSATVTLLGRGLPQPE